MVWRRGSALALRGALWSCSRLRVQAWRGAAATATAAARGVGVAQGAKSQEAPPPGGEFDRRVDRLPLSLAARETLAGMGLVRLFEIQARAFEPILRGRSFVGRSRTGTGKTVAYLLPALERLQQERMTLPHSVLILVPTRELCRQVAGTALNLLPTVDLALLHGGPDSASQEQLLTLGARVVVATPGPCVRLLLSKVITAQNVRMLVIDEADAMLGSEHFRHISKILNAVQKDGLQSILFSASMPPETLSMISEHFAVADFVDLIDRGGLPGVAAVQTVTHRLCRVPRARNERLRILLHILAVKSDELGGQCIIFVDSAVEAKAVHSHPVLQKSACVIHAGLATNERDKVLTAFKNKEHDVLITTDVVSRGVHFEDVNLVLQLHPPKDASQYVHRAGRTGRAGRGGACVMFYDPSEHALVKNVRETTKQSFRTEDAPKADDIHHRAVSRVMEELLTVQPSEYEGFMEEARRMAEEQGPRALATAMSVLDGRHADLARSAKEAPSLLSGLPGFSCLLAHDPDGATLFAEYEARGIVRSLLGQKAGPSDVGRISRTEDGWAIDVRKEHATTLLSDLRSGRTKAPFEVTVAQRLPKLKFATRLLKRTPWAFGAARRRRKSQPMPMDQ